MGLFVLIAMIAIVYGVMYVIISGLIDLAVEVGKRVFSFFKTQNVNIS